MAVLGPIVYPEVNAADLDVAVKEAKLLTDSLDQLSDCSTAANNSTSVLRSREATRDDNE